MNGATALINTLADCGVEFCIANPGTSEMHLVQALDAVPRMKSVLALFEGVCTGAADGVGRMTGNRRQHCSISDPAWPMVLPTCTMRAGAMHQ